MSLALLATMMAASVPAYPPETVPQAIMTVETAVAARQALALSTTTTAEPELVCHWSLVRLDISMAAMGHACHKAPARRGITMAETEDALPPGLAHPATTAMELDDAFFPVAPLCTMTMELENVC
jgi:hypothetical protein